MDSLLKESIPSKTLNEYIDFGQLLSDRYLTRTRRHIALVWILATQKEGKYCINPSRFVLNPDNVYSWRKINGYTYHMDTDRAIHILYMILKFIHLPQFNLYEPIPWHIIKKINMYIAPNNICEIFKKEALNDDYRMHRTFDEVASCDQTSGLSSGQNKWVDINPENVNRRGEQRYGYNKINDWKVGVRNGEIISQTSGYGEALKNLSDSRLPYPAPQSLGYSYPYEWPTVRLYEDHISWDAPKGRGVPGEQIRPWHNREHDTFYTFGNHNNETFWGSGPNKLVWRIYYNMKANMVGLSNCIKTREFNMDTPPTELVMRKMSSPAALYSVLPLPSIVKYNKKTSDHHSYFWNKSFCSKSCLPWEGHNFNPIEDCQMCIANTIKVVGNDESKKFRTRCILTYSDEMRKKIREVAYKKYPNLFTKNIDIQIPPLRRTRGDRKKSRKAKSK